MQKAERVVLFFDGYCNLCNGAVRFVLNNENAEDLKFASLQGQTAQKYLPSSLPDSLVMWIDGKIYVESTAALKLIPYLKWYFQFLRIMWIFPSILRNAVYRFIAKNRIHWFGSSTYCAVMQPQWKNRFLD
jgi:predicted DCC family thiol-disulfide oxidoreductase YuxK